ncbi:unnamed protein product [Calypogeia fissa]
MAGQVSNNSTAPTTIGSAKDAKKRKKGSKSINKGSRNGFRVSAKKRKLLDIASERSAGSTPTAGDPTTTSQEPQVGRSESADLQIEGIQHEIAKVDKTLLQDKEEAGGADILEKMPTVVLEAQVQTDQFLYADVNVEVQQQPYVKQTASISKLIEELQKLLAMCGAEDRARNSQIRSLEEKVKKSREIDKQLRHDLDEARAEMTSEVEKLVEAAQGKEKKQQEVIDSPHGMIELQHDLDEARAETSELKKLVEAAQGKEKKQQEVIDSLRESENNAKLLYQELEQELGTSRQRNGDLRARLNHSLERSETLESQLECAVDKNTRYEEVMRAQTTTIARLNIELESENNAKRLYQELEQELGTSRQRNGDLRA